MFASLFIGSIYIFTELPVILLQMEPSLVSSDLFWIHILQHEINVAFGRGVYRLVSLSYIVCYHLLHVCYILKSFLNMLIFNVNLEHIYFLSRKMMKVFSPPCSIVLPSYREVVAKVMATTSKPLDHNRTLCYERSIFASIY
jgi:hypothetical protein